MKLNSKLIIMMTLLGFYTLTINTSMLKMRRTKTTACYAPAEYKTFPAIEECKGFEEDKVEKYATMDVKTLFKCLHNKETEHIDKSGAATLSAECNSKNRFVGTYAYQGKALTSDDASYLNSALFAGRIVLDKEEYVYDSKAQKGFIAATNAPLGDPTDSKKMPIAKELKCPENNEYSNNQNEKGEYVATGGKKNENSCLSGNTMTGAKWDKENTILSFYKTLAAKKVDYVIQLTNFVEKMDETNKPCLCKVKADKYFGLNNDEVFDIKNVARSAASGATVTTKSLDSAKEDLFGSKDYANGDVRELSFKADATKPDTYKVTHVHFRGWLDFGVPANDDKTALVKLIKSIRKKMEAGKNVIVHCTGGIGRTGTFIASVLALDLADKTKKFNLGKFILELRKHRADLVETDTQLDFIAKEIVGKASANKK